MSESSSTATDVQHFGIDSRASTLRKNPLVNPARGALRGLLARIRRAAPLTSAVACSAVLLGQVPSASSSRCPEGAVAIDGQFCIDRFEDCLVRRRSDGGVNVWSPYRTPVGHGFEAVSRERAVPQGYITQPQALAACENAGKRLCTGQEWFRACSGPSGTTYPYGDTRESGACNDNRRRPIGRVVYEADQPEVLVRLTDPRINRLGRTLARSGEFERCATAEGVHDMVGNLHEWTGERRGRYGVFRGGFYVDATINGRGCRYTTRAHFAEYTDYSIGFRCCADPR